MTARRVRITGDLYHPQVPPGAVPVDRRTRWGNPHVVTPELPAETAVARFRADLAAGRLQPVGRRTTGVTLSDVRQHLQGRDLACWCQLDDPCHADVLLEMANG